MSSATSALAATIGTLRRLLEEEKTTLDQLTYVVENIHDPILECYGSPNDAKQVQPPGEKQNVASILTATEHQEVFGNIHTLYSRQKTIVTKLVTALRETNGKLETGSEGSDPIIKQELEVTALRNAVDIFCSSEMRRFIAEHVKFSISYSSTIAPKILALWHRCCPVQGKNAGGRLGVTNSLVCVSDKRGELNYRKRFLCFLWWSLGERNGVPSDPRAVQVRLPDSLSTLAPTGQSRPDASRTVRSNAGDSSPETRFKSAKDAVRKTFCCLSAGWDDSVIPPTWQGFETLLALLATPLPSLRRYVHVACCVVNTHCLQKAIRQQLQFDFVSTAKRRLAEEGCLVLSELVKQDTGLVTSLIDGAGAASADTAKAAALLPGYTARKFARIDPNKDGARVLIHYGRLTKKFRRGRHERLVFLFNDWFCYGEEHVNNQLLLRASISLDGLKVVDHGNAEDGENSFDVVTRKTRFSFIAPTQEQKQQWVDALRNSVRLYEKSVAKPLSSNNTDGRGPSLVERKSSAVLPTNFVRLSENSRLFRQQRADRLVQGQLSTQRATFTAPTVTCEEVVGPVAMQATLAAPGDVGASQEGVQRLESPPHLGGDEPENQVGGVNAASEDDEWVTKEHAEDPVDVESDDSGDIADVEECGYAEGEVDVRGTMVHKTEESEPASDTSTKGSPALQQENVSLTMEQSGSIHLQLQQELVELGASSHTTGGEPNEALGSGLSTEYHEENVITDKLREGLNEEGGGQAPNEEGRESAEDRCGVIAGETGGEARLENEGKEVEVESCSWSNEIEERGSEGDKAARRWKETENVEEQVQEEVLEEEADVRQVEEWGGEEELHDVLNHSPQSCATEYNVSPGSEVVSPSCLTCVDSVDEDVSREETKVNGEGVASEKGGVAQEINCFDVPHETSNECGKETPAAPHGAVEALVDTSKPQTADGGDDDDIR